MDRLKKLAEYLLHWLSANTSHAIGVVVFMSIATFVKSLKDDESVPYFLNHPKELLSPALIAILCMAIVGLMGIVLQQRAKLRSFGVRVFSRHDSDKVRAEDWNQVIKDIIREDREGGAISLLGATGKETFSGATSPLFDTLKAFRGSIRILLIEPNSFAFRHRYKSLKQSPESYRDEILDSLDYCSELKKNGSDIEVCLYGSLPIWKMVMTNKTLWVQFYKKGVHVDKTPIYCFENNDERLTLFDGFCSVFAKRWSLDGSKSVNLDLFNRNNWELHCQAQRVPPQ